MLNKVKLVFVGNSLTRKWLSEGQKLWQTYFNTLTSPYYALNLGVSGEINKVILFLGMR